MPTIAPIATHAQQAAEDASAAEGAAKTALEAAVADADERRKVDREELTGLRRQLAAAAAAKAAAEGRVGDLEAAARRHQDEVRWLLLSPIQARRTIRPYFLYFHHPITQVRLRAAWKSRLVLI